MLGKALRGTGDAEKSGASQPESPESNRVHRVHRVTREAENGEHDGTEPSEREAAKRKPSKPHMPREGSSEPGSEKPSFGAFGPFPSGNVFRQSVVRESTEEEEEAEKKSESEKASDEDGEKEVEVRAEAAAAQAQEARARLEKAKAWQRDAKPASGSQCSDIGVGTAVWSGKCLAVRVHCSHCLLQFFVKRG
ncbi:unnamed protein product, partial [Effrenium voratum]